MLPKISDKKMSNKKQLTSNVYGLLFFADSEELPTANLIQQLPQNTEHLLFCQM